MKQCHRYLEHNQALLGKIDFDPGSWKSTGSWKNSSEKKMRGNGWGKEKKNVNKN